MPNGIRDAIKSSLSPFLFSNGQQPTTYQYDMANRLTRVAQGALFTQLGYDNANRRIDLSYSNGTNTNYAYDLASRLTGITHNGPSGIIEALTYQYDAAGNRPSLTRANGTASLLPNAVASAAYDAANEQTAFAGTTQQYDPNGNLTSDGVNTYQWDARDRLTAINGPGVSASFVYDPLGRRISRTLGAQTTNYLYDRTDVVSEINGSAVSATLLGGLTIDEHFIRQTAAGSEFYHLDAVGSTLHLTNQSGSVQTSYSYEAFGKTSVTGISSNAFQYTGRENDGTGLYYYRTRYYSPGLQRFIREDSIGFQGGINLYAYAFNNPLTHYDPFGTEPCPPISGCVTHPSDGYCYAWVTVTPSSQPGTWDVQIGPDPYYRKTGPVPSGSTYVSSTSEIARDSRGRPTFGPPPGATQPPDLFGPTSGGTPVNQTIPANPGDWIQVIVPPQNTAESGGIFNKQLKCPLQCNDE